MSQNNQSTEPEPNDDLKQEDGSSVNTSILTGKDASPQEARADNQTEKVSAQTPPELDTDNASLTRETQKRTTSLKTQLRELDLNQKLTLLLSILAILFSFFATVFTLTLDVRSESRQEELQVTQEAMQQIQSAQAAARATFEVEVQANEIIVNEEQNNLRATQVSITQLQLNLEQDQQSLEATQTAYQGALVSLHQQLAYPYIQIVKTPEPFFISDAHTSNLSSATSPDIASNLSSATLPNITSSVNLILANNGGGQASLVTVEFLQENTQQNNLTWEIQRVALSPDKEILLPFNMPGQTAFSFILELNGQFEDYDRGDQLGITIVEELEETLKESVQYIRFEFSNTDPLEIPIILTIDPSLFFEKTTLPTVIPVTIFDESSTVCFDILGNLVDIEAVFNYQGKNGFNESSHAFPFSQANLDSSCWSLPAGYYTVDYFLNESYPISILIDAKPNETRTIELEGFASFLPTPIPTPTPTPTPPHPISIPFFDLKQPFLGIVGFVFLASTIVFFVQFALPWLSIRTFSPPPDGYLKIIDRNSKSRSRTISLTAVGLRHRTSKIVIGGDKKKSHIFIENLLPQEFIVTRQDNRIIVRQVKGNRNFIIRKERPQEVRTSQQEIFLLFNSTGSQFDEITDSEWE